MSNIKRINITGRIPYDCCTKHQDLCRFFGQMNNPTFGFRVSYTGRETGKPNNHGGVTTFCEFAITGEEAVGDGWITGLLQALVNADADLDVGKRLPVTDIENNETYNLPIPKKQPGLFVAEVRITVENPDELDKAEPDWTLRQAMEGKLTLKLVGSEGSQGVFPHPMVRGKSIWVQVDMKNETIRQA